MNEPTSTTAPQRTVEIPEHLYRTLLERADIWGRDRTGRNAVQDLEVLLACGRKAGVY